MVKEFIDAVDAKKAASMQSPQDAGSLGIPYETNQPEMQDPFGGVNFDDEYGIDGATVDALWGSTQSMQSPFESADQLNQQSTLAGRQSAMAKRDDDDEYKKFWENDLKARGMDIATRTKLPDDAWGNDILTRDLRKVDPLGNRGHF
jgi:hypothetical protein